MTSNAPYIRKVKLVIGPLSESEGGGPSDQAVIIESTGDRQSLRIRANVKKSLLSAPNASDITITNLSPEIRDRIKTSLTKVSLFAGWENTDLFLLASGGIMSAVPSENPPDTELTLSVLDGFDGQIRGVVSETFTPGATVESVIRGLAAKMPGVETGDILVDGNLPTGGFSFAGRAADALDALAGQYGFSWSIQDGTLQAIQDTRSVDRVIELSWRYKNLISVSPILSGPMQIENGVSVSSLMDPRAIPGGRVHVESRVNPKQDGLYKIHTLDFAIDTHSSTYTMEIKSFKEIL